MKADHIGTCYLCGETIWNGDEINRWMVANVPVAAHQSCVDEKNKCGMFPAKESSDEPSSR